MQNAKLPDFKLYRGLDILHSKREEVEQLQQQPVC